MPNRGPGTGTNYEKRINGTRYSVRKFEPRKRALAVTFLDFPLFSGNFPVGRTDEECSIYHRTGNPEILTKWKAPQVNIMCQFRKTKTKLLKMHAQLIYKQNEIQYYKHTL